MTSAQAIRLALTPGGISTLLIVAAILVFLAGIVLDQPMLALVFGFAPIGAIIAWTQPFVVCSLFIAFSYFRLHEAYPSLATLRPALLLGMGAVTLVAVKALLSPDREQIDSRVLRALCLLALVATAGIAAPFGELQSDGTATLTALVLPAVMGLASVCVLAWARLLSVTGEAPMPLNMKLFLAYFVCITLATIFSEVPSDSFRLWSGTMWKVAAMSLAIVWLARSETDFWIASNVFVFSGAILAVLALYNGANGISLVEGTRVAIGREIDEATGLNIGGILSDPNDLALILLFPFAFALGRIVQKTSWFDALVSIGCSGLMLAGIVVT